MKINMYAIETISLTKKFGSVKAVDRLDLRVPEGSIYGFLGPNGAGKTTTIKMLTGLSAPTSGSMKICEKNVTFGSIKNRSDIGYLPDVPYFYGWMSAREYLAFSADMFGLDKSVLGNRISELLQLVGLEDNKKRIKGYSRGMKQRLGIAQALISEPKVLFLDEPTSALDPIGRKEIMEVIKKLTGKITVFFSTHILSDVERVCDRVVILDKGQVVTENSINNLREQYAVNAFLLKVPEIRTNEILDILKKSGWVTKIEKTEDGDLKAYVKTIEKAESEIPVILASKGIPLSKFTILEPSLEDIFMKVVNE